MTEVLIDWLRTEHQILIDSGIAESIKHAIGSAYQYDREPQVTVTGRDIVKGIPKQVLLEASEVRNALSPVVNNIVEAIRLSLSQTPPALVSDIDKDGAWITGGGSLLKQMDKKIAEDLGIPINTSEDPLSSVVIGSGICLERFQDYKSILKLWEKYLLGIRKSGSSCGAIIEVRARGIPVGLGAPIYSKLDMDLASAMMSINAVKGVNIGSGMNSALLTGEENSDEIVQKGKSPIFKSNNAGGILGGISSGQEIIVSFAVKPTSSILRSRKTIDKFGKNTSISVRGRHDPCVGIRAVPIGEAMTHCVLLDHYLMNKAQCGK